MATNPLLVPRRSWLAFCLLLIVSACAAPAPVAQSPLPPGQARIWLYRAWEPSESLNLANVDVNGSYFGSVANGGVFYRDVSPGHYHIAPVSFAGDFDQDRNVNLAPGQQLYVKVLSLVSWGSGNSASRSFQRDAFYARVVPPQVARGEIARDRNGI